MCSFADVVPEVEVQPLNGKENNLICPIGVIIRKSLFTFSVLSSVRIQCTIKNTIQCPIYNVISRFMPLYMEIKDSATTAGIKHTHNKHMTT